MNVFEGRLSCPNCGTTLWEDQDRVYPTTPASRYTWCKKEGCDFEGLRTLGHNKVLLPMPVVPEPEPEPEPEDEE